MRVPVFMAGQPVLLGMKAPLRKIVREYVNRFGVVREVLECGHEQHRKQDAYGPTRADARRCKKCGLVGEPPR